MSESARLTKDMLIDQLPQQTLENLYSSLENGPTVDWRALALIGFSSLYSDENKMAKIEKSDRPARGLLCDLTNRHKTVAELLEALEVIENKRATSIVMDGIKKRHVNLGMPHPPGPSTGQPQENCDVTTSQTVPMQIWGQAVTLKYPVQETVIRDQNPSHPAQQPSLGDYINKIFACFFKDFSE